MTQEEKQLLLKDLCARLPYVIICNDIHGDSIVTYIDLEEACVYLPDFDECMGIDDIKPYLRPMSSMTDEEIDRMWEIYESGPAAESSVAVSEYLYGNHLDCHYLIEKGLALEATEGMYKTE